VSSERLAATETKGEWTDGGANDGRAGHKCVLGRLQ
jgi:hypothetical protein